MCIRNRDMKFGLSEMTNYVQNKRTTRDRKIINITPPRLALIEMASFCGGVHHKRYNGEQDKTP